MKAVLPLKVEIPYLRLLKEIELEKLECVRI
jgi:hypothetical protein